MMRGLGGGTGPGGRAARAGRRRSFGRHRAYAWPVNGGWDTEILECRLLAKGGLSDHVAGTTALLPKADIRTSRMLAAED